VEAGRDGEREEPDMGSRARVNGRAMIGATLYSARRKMPTPDRESARTYVKPDHESDTSLIAAAGRGFVGGWLRSASITTRCRRGPDEPSSTDGTPIAIGRAEDEPNPVQIERADEILRAIAVLSSTIAVEGSDEPP